MNTTIATADCVLGSHQVFVNTINPNLKIKVHYAIFDS